ncbi:testis-specific serine/threonine-protein kinase 1-like [Carcharodon carcharias]|uniref:testis-specific serine/threonine-protein kinase 1-like n=1 Tax=Carcharodon carcharias TaxID=13397 RepID=UPI001B7ECA8D|nr:testis-specific serine/threonine-protein kinase 1-like [Carcharodon carcharias]
MDDGVVLKKRGYTLGVNLGEGSYAKVKSAYSDRLKTNVAVKIIDRRKAPADFLEKFLPRELEILALLNHRYIVKTFEIFETSDGKVYIIMELGVQGDLLEFIKTRGALPEEVSRKMFRQLALAVKHCHELDVVHRDLKCENLLLDKDFNVKLSDFGFAKRCSTDDQGRPLLSKTFCGSAAYAAPEVLQGIPYQPKVYDVWSLGVILFIMVCGSMPYDDSNIKRMLRIQKEHRVDFPRSKVVPADCKELIYRMLHPDTSKRLTIDEVLEHPWVFSAKMKEASTTKKVEPSTEKREDKHGHTKEEKHEGKSEQKHDPKYQWEIETGHEWVDMKHEAKHEWMNMKRDKADGKQEAQAEHKEDARHEEASDFKDRSSPQAKAEEAKHQSKGGPKVEYKNGAKAGLRQGKSPNQETKTEAETDSKLEPKTEAKGSRRKSRSLRLTDEDHPDDSEVYPDQESFLEAQSKAELKKVSSKKSKSVEKKGKHSSKSRT